MRTNTFGMTPCVIIAAIPKCGRVFDHRDHKERKEAANLHLICRFFVFSVLFVVECVLHFWNCCHHCIASYLEWVYTYDDSFVLASLKSFVIERTIPGS